MLTSKSHIYRMIPVTFRTPFLAIFFLYCTLFSFGQQSGDAAFRKALRYADSVYSSPNPAPALSAYLYANRIKAGDAHVAKRIAELENRRSVQMKANEKASSDIYLAEKNFRSGNIQAARELLKELRQQNLSDPDLMQRLQNLSGQMDEHLANEAAFSHALQEGKEWREKKLFNKALTRFEDALKIKPGDSGTQMEKNTTLVQKNAASVPYKAELALAAKAMELQDYTKAFSHYQKASEIMPEEAEANSGLQSVKDLLSYQNELKEFYARSIEEGDKAFRNGNFEAASKHYKQALDYDPDADYPKSQIRNMQNLKEDEQSREIRFGGLVKEADRLLATEDIEGAFELYTQASNIKSKDTYVDRRLRELNPRVTSLRVRKEEYNRLIRLGDEEYNGGRMEQALIQYNKAKELQPSEAYPKSQIALINKALDDLKIQRTQRDELLKGSEKALASMDFETALRLCEEALLMYPEYSGAITLKERIIREQQAHLLRQANYSQLISQGDSLLGQGLLTEARKSFIGASGIKPSEIYPKNKIKELDAAIESRRKEERAFTDKVSAAERYFGEGKLSEAKTQFLLALEIKPGDRPIVRKVERIDSLIADRQNKEILFTGLMAEGEEKLAANLLDDAEENFRKAASVLPASPLPNTKLKIISGIRAEAARKSSKTDLLIATGERQMAQKDYSSASKSFTEALGLSPSHPLALKRLAESDSLLQQEIAQNKLFQATLDTANLLFTSGNQEEALTAYQRADRIKPGDKLVAVRIADISKAINIRMQTDENYQKELERADAAYTNGNLREALNGYELALKYKPKESYPLTKIGEISQKLEEQAAIERNYTEIIRQADQFKLSGKYNEARSSYHSAMAVKPNESYPSAQIRIVDSLINLENQLLNSYTETVAQADRALETQDLRGALALYQKALTFKPSEKYATERVALVLQWMKEKAKAEEDAFNLAMDNAEKFIQKQEYNKAIESLEQALTLKPEESVAVTKLAEVNQIIDNLKKINEAYRLGIQEADSLYGRKEWQNALAAYDKALGWKPEEIYPVTRKKEIQGILQEMQDKETTYLNLLNQGDRLFESQMWNEALLTYQQALTIKPGESHPTLRTAWIQKKLEELAVQAEQYKSAIQKADAFYTGRFLQEARKSYTDALLIKPEDSYAKERLAQVEEEILFQETRQRNYSDAVAKGDSLFRSGLLKDALSAYENASGIIPSEPYPGQRMEEINNILKNRALLEKNFAISVREGDSCFDIRLYERALNLYLKASNLKPSEAYPKERIAELNALLSTPREVEGITYEKAFADGLAANRRNDLGQAFDNFLIALHLEPHRQEAADNLLEILERTTTDTLISLQKEPISLNAGNVQSLQINAPPENLRENAYIIIQLSGEAREDAKVVVNFGRARTTHGGIVVRLLKNPVTNTYIGSLSGQQSWTGNLNTWISLLAERTDLKIERVYLSKAR